MLHQLVICRMHRAPLRRLLSKRRTGQGQGNEDRSADS